MDSKEIYNAVSEDVIEIIKSCLELDNRFLKKIM